MKDIEYMLENLDVPTASLPQHEKNLKKLVLFTFEKSSKKPFLRGGEYMEFVKEHISKRVAAGIFIAFFAVAFLLRFGMPSTQQANAQELVQNALKKASLLSAADQANIATEKVKLQKAEKAADLHVVSTVQNRTTLRFTDENGQEETIELEDDQIVRPSATPTVTGTATAGTSVTPGVTGVRPSVSKSREEERESVKAEKHESEKGVSGSNGGSTQSVQKESEGVEKKDD